MAQKAGLRNPDRQIGKKSLYYNGFQAAGDAAHRRREQSSRRNAPNWR